jgi:hypothetical protein
VFDLSHNDVSLLNCIKGTEAHDGEAKANADDDKEEEHDDNDAKLAPAEPLPFCSGEWQGDPVLKTPDKGITVRKTPFSVLEKPRFFCVVHISQFIVVKSPQTTLSNTQSSQKIFAKNFTRVSLNIKPSMIPLFTVFDVDIKNHTLKPYMAPVNHNVLNETSFLKIVHTFYGNFCQESDDKYDMNAMETMGNDACVIVGCHEKVSKLTAKV